MTTQNPFQDDLIQEIFGQDPGLAFLGHLGQSQLPQRQQDFFRGRASDFLQRFNMALGRQLAQGQLPTLTPDEFFGGTDFQQELMRFSPRDRGMGTSQFNPRTRFLF